MAIKKLKATALALGLASQTQVANADTVVYAGESGAQSDKSQDTTNVPNNSRVNELNSLIRNIQTKANGIIKLKDAQISTSDDQIDTVKNKLNTLSNLVDQYNRLKDQLETQNNSNEAVNGMRGADNTVDVTGNNLDETISKMQAALTQMQAAIDYNSGVVNRNTYRTAQDRVLNDKVKQANETITGSANTIKHYKDGIIGDLDKVKRASDDSRAANGIDVDNTETQRINTVVTDQKVADTQTHVKTVDEVNSNLQRILNNIVQSNQTNHEQAGKAAFYRSNALFNIPDINEWLTQMRQLAAKGREEAAKHKTALAAMDQFKSSSTSALQDAINQYKASGWADQSSLDQMQQALNGISSSSITQETINVGQTTPIEFGDIGTPQDEQNGAQDGTIKNTKEQEMAKLTSAINQAVATAAANDAAANASIQAAKAKNDANVQKIIAAAKEPPATPEERAKYEKDKAQYDSDKQNYQKASEAYKQRKEKWEAEHPGQKYEDAQKDAVLTQDQINQIVSALAAGSSDVQSSLSRDISEGQKDDINAIEAKVKSSDDNSVNQVPDGVNMYSVIAAVKKKKTEAGVMPSGIAAGYTWRKEDLANATWESQEGRWYSGTADGVIKTIIQLGGNTNVNDSALLKGGAASPWYRDYVNQYAGSGWVTMASIGTNPDATIHIPNAFTLYDMSTGQTYKAGIKLTIAAYASNGQSLQDYIKAHSHTDKPTAFIIQSVSAGQDGKLHIGVGAIDAYGIPEGTGIGGKIVYGHGEGLSFGSTDLSLNELIDNSERSSTNGQAYYWLTDGQLKNAGLRMKVNWSLEYPGASYAATHDFNSIVGKMSNAFSNLPIAVGDIDDYQTLTVQTGTIYHGSQIQLKGQGVSSKYMEPQGNGGQVNLKTNNDNTINLNNLVMDQVGLTKNFEFNREANGIEYLSEDAAFGGSGIAVLPIGDTPPTEPKPPKPPVEPVKIDVATASGVVNNVDIAEPNAHAETKGTYSLNSAIEYLYADSEQPQLPKDMSIALLLDQIKGLDAKDRKTSSNTSLIVRKQTDTPVKTGSGNSMVVKYKGQNVLTSSGNSMVVRALNPKVTTGSGNSMIVKALNGRLISGSGNSMVVRTIDGGQALLVHSGLAASPKTSVQNGVTHVAMSFYVDPEIMNSVKTAISDWNKALINQNVQIDASYTSSTSDLAKGVTVAVMNTVSDNEITSSLQKPGEVDGTMRNYAGWTTAVARDILTGNGLNDVFNASGTVTAGEMLRKSLFTVQINSERLNLTGNSDALVSTIKHELGHVFGLEHDTDDTLMTTHADSNTFTGEISQKDAQIAAENLKFDPSKPKDLFK